MGLATLSIDIEARLAKFEGDMGKATRLLDKLANDANRAGTSVRDVFAGVTISRAFEEGIRAAIDLFPRLIEGVAAFQDLSETTSASAEGLAKFQTASDVSGVKIEDLAGLSIKLTASLGKITDESKGAGQALQNLGINAAAFRALRPEQQIELLSQKFGEFADGVGKTSNALALFGKSGPQILKFFKEYGDGAEQVSRLTAEQIAAADAFADANAKASSQLRQTAQVIAVQALPAIAAVKQGFTDGAKAVLGLDGAASELGLNRSILDFAERGAVGLAILVDALVGVGKTARAIAGSVSVVLSDAVTLGAIFSASAKDQLDFVLRDQGPLSEAFAKRESNLKAAGQRYTDLWTYNGIATSDAIRKSFSAQRATFDTEYQRELKRNNERASTLNPKATLASVSVPDAASAQKDDAFQKFLDKLTKQRNLAEAELSIGGRLSDADRTRISLLDELTAKEAKFTAEQIKQGQASVALLVTKLEELDLQRLTLEARRASQAIEDRQIQSVQTEVAARIESNKSVRESIEEIGLNERQLEALRITRLEHKLGIEEESLAMLQNAEASQRQIAAAEQSIELLRQQIKLTKEQAEKQREIARDPQQGAKKALDEFLLEIEEKGKAVYDATKTAQGLLMDDLTQSLKSGRLDVKRTIDFMITEFLRLQVVRPILGQIFSAAGAGVFSKLFGFKYGGVFGAPVAFASGGVVDSPQLFKFAQGGTMKTGLMGEAGPEAILPLRRGPDGALGVRSTGSRSVIINQYLTVGAGVPRSEVMAAMQVAKSQAVAEINQQTRRAWA